VSEENLKIAFYDEEASSWEYCQCTCHPDEDWVTGSVRHFSVFSIIGGLEPARFTLGSLSVSPAEVAPGEDIKVSFIISNTGDLEGDYLAVVEANGEEVASRNIRLAAGTDETVSLSIVLNEPGRYSISVDGLIATATVTTPVGAAPPEPSPATTEDVEAAPETATPETAAPPAEAQVEEEPTAELSHWWIIIGGIGGILIILLLTFLIMRRRR
jgi:hypothetical protein